MQPRAQPFASLLFAVAAVSIVATLLCAPALASTASTVAGAATDSASTGRLIVLGFDGADARIAAEMMDAGELPHLAKLRERGTFAPLATTMPAESPVSWASLNSGQNPAKTGIPGFVRRELGASGDPLPNVGFYDQGSRPLDSFEVPRGLALLAAHEPPVVGAAIGAAVFLVFLVLLAALLRIRAKIAAPLALILGGLGGWAGYVASGYIPRAIDDVVSNRTQVGGFWEPAARAGIACIVLDGAMAWDRPPVENARVLAGLGVPDARGAYGDWFVYTTEEKEFSRAPQGRSTSTGGKVFRVDERDGRIESRIFGPRNVWAIDRLRRELSAIEGDLVKVGLDAKKSERLRARKRQIEEQELSVLEGFESEEGRLSVPLVVERSTNGTARVRIDDSEQELFPGAWSSWYSLRFEVNALLHVQAITRVKIETLEPFRLFVDFLHLDPNAPPFWQPISQPASFAGDLARTLGEPYETVGWACLTMPLKDREIDAVTFLEDIQFTSAAREKLLFAALPRDDWKLLMFVESTPDRVQHMAYRYYDQAHPLYEAAQAERRLTFYGRDIRLADAIPAVYREMDRLVGAVVDNHLQPGDTLLVCADHGFQSFRRQVHLNNWLLENGFLALREGLTRADGNALAFVDWSKTRAYALGLGGIYLNLRDRERQGIVASEDAPALLDELRAKLLSATDPDTGAKVVREVYRSDAIHSGPYLEDESELLVGFEAGYRVGWSTTSGGIRLVQTDDKTRWVAGASLEDNRNHWSGDHVSVAEDLVRGIFFSNRRIELPPDGANLLHIAPTALAILGVPIPPEYDRRPLKLLD